MDVQIKELEYCKVEVLYSADPEVVESKRDEVLAEIRNTVHIPGFRPGKAPDSAIRIKLSKQIAIHVAEQMKAQAYDDAVFETEIKPMGMPKFDDVSISGNNFSCKMTLYKRPEFELQNFRYEIPKPDINRDVEVETEGTLENLRMRFGDVEPYGDDDFVERGDQVTMSFDATIDGQPFEGSSSEGQLYVVGEKSLPSFDDNVLGMSAGETREFEVTFPDNYTSDLAGKTAKFTVTIIMGAKKVPCALDDELAVQCGEESLDSLRDRLRKISSAKIKQDENLKIRQQIVIRLVEDHDFKVPSFLTDLEAQHICMQNGIDWSSLEDSEKEVFKEQGEKHVKLSLILNEIRENEPDSVLSDAEAQKGLVKRATMHGQDPNQFLVEARQNGSLIGMLSALKDEFTLQWLVDEATIIE